MGVLFWKNVSEVRGFSPTWHYSQLPAEAEGLKCVKHMLNRVKCFLHLILRVCRAALVKPRFVVWGFVVWGFVVSVLPFILHV